MTDRPDQESPQAFVLELALSAGGNPAMLGLRSRTKTLLHTAEGRGTALTEAIGEACCEIGARPRDIDHVRVEVGPGSFTGLRTSVVTARTAAELGNASISSFTRFELLAVAAWRGGAPTDTPLTFALDARRRRLHMGRVELRGGVATLLELPKAIRTEEFDVDAHPIVLAESTLDLWIADGGGTLLDALPVPEPQDLFDRRLRPELRNPSEVLPLYLMGTYADEPI